MIDLLYGLIGVTLLFLGRRLFWLFVGSVGFVFGLQMAQQYLGLHPFWVTWAVALLFGLIGALMAVFVQTLAIGLGGFAVGSAISAHLMVLSGYAAVPGISVLCGIIGAVLLYVLFDWALIGLSSVAGATLVVLALNWSPRAEGILYVILIAAGICFQAVWLRRQKPKTK